MINSSVLKWYQSKLFLLLCLAVIPCVSFANFSVTDARGNTFDFDQPAQRVVVLAPHLVEIIYAVGGEDTLIGAVSYSDYPEAAKALPRVGSYKDFSAEALFRLKPDLIIGWGSGNGDVRLKQLESLGFRVFWSDVHSLDDVASAMRTLGKITGAANTENTATEFESSISSLRQQFSHREPISVFYEVWNSPLQTLNGEHLISAVIRLCGGTNVFASEPVLGPKISVESVIRKNPQVIIASGMGQERPEWLDEWLTWPQIQAVEKKQLHFIHPDIIQRHTPRILQGAELMCAQLDEARQAYYHQDKKPLNR